MDTSDSRTQIPQQDDLALRPRKGGLRVLRAIDENRSAACLLMTSVRNAEGAGPLMREAHIRIGQYLAANILADEIGLVEYTMNRKPGEGYMLEAEQETVIVALMRGGEPMALGVKEIFPRASLIHAFHAKDVKLQHVRGTATVVLADATVTTGRSVVEYVDHIRNLDENVRILVVTSEVRSDSIVKGSHMEVFARESGFTIITLCISDTDTGAIGGADT